jgi:hypothetical protein
MLFNKYVSSSHWQLLNAVYIEMCMWKHVVCADLIQYYKKNALCWYWKWITTTHESLVSCFHLASFNKFFLNFVSFLSIYFTRCQRRSLFNLHHKLLDYEFWIYLLICLFVFIIELDQYSQLLILDLNWVCYYQSSNTILLSSDSST